MKRNSIPGLLLIILFTFSVNSQELTRDNGFKLSIMFYNTENLFDTIDSDLDDDEFLPASIRRWNTYKYNQKLNKLFKVIVLAGDEMEMPDIIGLCEVENEEVLNHLCHNTYLYREDYEYLLSKGYDARGINTALLYRGDNLRLLDNKSWNPPAINKGFMSTRGILYCKFKIHNDTLHTIVCHWPSRRGGVIESERKRKIVAAFLKEKIDSIGYEKKIVIMGDFNDEPGSESIRQSLVVKEPGKYDIEKGLINISSRQGNNKGTYKFQESWYMFDQMMVSNALFTAVNGLVYESKSFSILNKELLLIEDPNYPGYRPYSTWWGYKYINGYSDHLPITMRINYQ